MQGSMSKFLVRPSNISENPVEHPIENPVEHPIENPVENDIASDDNENFDSACDDDNIDNACDDDNIDNARDRKNPFVDDIGVNIFDPRVLDGLNSKMRDLLVEKGPIRDTNIVFPKDNIGRHFSSEFYVRKLRNGDCYDRKWLAYSKELDKVFCFCCKLFKDGRSTSQLASDGLNCRKQLGQRLNIHENS